MKNLCIPFGSSRWTTFLLAAPAILGAAAAQTQNPIPPVPTGSSLLVRAHIDGRSRLVLEQDSARWIHFDYAAPGRLGCDTGEPFKPTVLGYSEWYPQWPDVPDCENRWCNCASDVFTGMAPTLPDTGFVAVLELVDVRGGAWIIEQPTPANGFRVVIEFDDNPTPGAAWYEVVLHVTDCETTRFCSSPPNSTGQPGRIAMGGTPGISANDCWLEATQCPPGQFGLFIYGQERARIPIGDGFLCISPFQPGLVRLMPPFVIDPLGRAESDLDFPSLPLDGRIDPGSTWCFQGWYRDPIGGGAGYNFTDAIEVTFCP